MELPNNDCDGTNPVTSFNFVLSDSLGIVVYILFYYVFRKSFMLFPGGNDLLDGETAVPLVFSTDFDLNKLWKNANGVQVVFIDSSQVNKPQCICV